MQVRSGDHNVIRDLCSSDGREGEAALKVWKVRETGLGGRASGQQRSKRSGGDC